MAVQGSGSLSFEEAFVRLEGSVERLEHGGLTLEEALSLYQEGMDLARRCAELLEQAEVRITRLSALAEDDKPQP